MKSINFQRNKSLIRIVNENSKKKKQRNWDRILYLCLLGLFILFLTYYILSKFIFMHAHGHVIIESTLITPSDPPKATRGTSPTVDLERNSILREPEKKRINDSTKHVFLYKETDKT